LIQGCLGAMIFWVLGLASPVLWGLMLGLSSVVPVFGTAIVWAPQGLWLMVNGETWKGITLLVFGAAIISSVDNVLRPFLITGRSQMNTLMVFIAVVGGIQAFGGVGTVLGPVLLSTASGLMRAYDEQSEIEAIPLQAIALTTE
jgi:predicted PurR-regulated permease PerM